MKIGFDAKRFFFNHSGLGNYSRQLLESLFQHHPEHEYVLYVDRLDALDHAHPEALRILKQYGEQGIVGKKKSPYTLMLVNAPKWWRIWGMGKRAAEDGVEVFHGLSNELPWDLPKSIKSICTIHDVLFKEFPGYYKWWDRVIYHFKSKRAIDLASHLVMTSRATQSQVEHYYPNSKLKSSVIYQGVDEVFFKVSNEPDNQGIVNPYFVYQSSFTNRKNHLALLEAFALIQKQTQWNLMLIGLEGSTLKDVRAAVGRLSLSNRVTCRVDVSKEEMIGLVKAASGFVYPSMNEGFGIPLGEALAANLPMAVSRIPVFHELGEEMPVYFHPNKPDEMAEAMIRITQSEEQTRQRMLRESLRQKIDSAQITSQWVNLYTSLIN